MRRFWSFVFILLYFFATFRPIAPYIEYQLNKDYIAEFLCINRDKPALQCHGKCYLSKMIEETQKEEPVQIPREVNMSDYPIGFVDLLSISTCNFEPIISHFSGYFCHYKFLREAKIFRPPIH